MSEFDGVLDAVIADLRQRSRKAEYRNDPALWVEEVLGKHLWSKQREIAQNTAKIRDEERRLLELEPDIEHLKQQVSDG